MSCKKSSIPLKKTHFSKSPAPKNNESKDHISLRVKSRRFQKLQEKQLKKLSNGFRLNPYFEQKDYSCLKPKHRQENLGISSQLTNLKRSRGRPPKKRHFANSNHESSKFNLKFLLNYD